MLHCNPVLHRRAVVLPAGINKLRQNKKRRLFGIQFMYPPIDDTG